MPTGTCGRSNTWSGRAHRTSYFSTGYALEWRSRARVSSSSRVNVEQKFTNPTITRRVGNTPHATQTARGFQRRHELQPLSRSWSPVRGRTSNITHHPSPISLFYFYSFFADFRGRRRRHRRRHCCWCSLLLVVSPPWQRRSVTNHVRVRARAWHSGLHSERTSRFYRLVSLLRSRMMRRVRGWTSSSSSSPVLASIPSAEDSLLLL